jgi:hypothetical protein
MGKGLRYLAVQLESPPAGNRPHGSFYRSVGGASNPPVWQREAR